MDETVCVDRNHRKDKVMVNRLAVSWIPDRNEPTNSRHSSARPTKYPAQRLSLSSPDSPPPTGRLAVTAASAIALSLVLGLGFAISGFISANQARQLAQQEADNVSASLQFIEEDFLGKLDPLLSHEDDE